MHLPVRSARKASASKSRTRAASNPAAARGPAQAPQPSWQTSPAAVPSSRARLLACCSGTAVLAATVAMPLVLLSASLGGEARADGCMGGDQSAGYACYYVVQPSSPPSGPNNGDAGTPGAAAAAVEVDVPGATYPAGQAVNIQVYGQGGGQGRNGHYGDVGSSGGIGGAGGTGGAGNTLTVTMAPNTTVNAQTTIVSGGGDGGVAGHSSHQNTEPTPGNGGAAGNIVVGTMAAPISANLTNPGPAGTGLSVNSLGGAGAAGTDWDSGPTLGESSNYDGGDGGRAGAGGSVNIVLQGAVTGAQAGIFALSQGGNGGDGGKSGGEGADGSSGGNGGNGALGSSVSVSLLSGSRSDGPGTGIIAQSFGGQGGQGGKGVDASSGGTAGTGADAGSVYVLNDGAIQTGLFDAPGILAQSFGGAGGTGGSAGGWGASGGNGGTGGNGNTITIQGGTGGSISTAGANSQGILAQSVGGGGGSGGNAQGWSAIGGDGASPGVGQAVTINSANAITTTGERSTGIMAQSIGGGGGNGGNASSSAIGPLNLVIGGSGSGGGNGGDIQAANSGVITTSGLHSSGIVMQTIGGGGGNGGSAYSGTNSAGVGASVAIGGNGGGGGAGGNIILGANSGRILTSGANSHGVVGQSIGGGGGTGGLSGATATTYSAATDEVPVPTVSVSVAIGGNGGNGGSGHGVTLQNSGLIATAGGGSVGLVGQSIGGGGGSGGDASATASAKGGDDSPVNIATAVAIGGRAGGGGAGGPLTITNGGMVFTRGEAADAVLAQSIGGGGGNGGGGDAQAKSSGDGTNIATALSLGGTAGGGGNGGPVSVTNTGALLTLGDGAIGILAQSVGGGGGRGGGAAGTSNGQFSASVSLGASGGAGGSTVQPNGSAVTVTNQNGTIVTFGADAPAIVAQSIGGGGGIGGKSASTLGSSTSTGDGGNGAAGSVSATTTSLNAAFQAGGEGQVNQYNSVSGLIGVSNQALGNVTATRGLGDDGDADALEGLGNSGGESGDDSSSTSINVRLNIGGPGGSGNSAGDVNVNNSGSIGTVGAMSDGILAQAIGGGGGRGGAAISSVTDGSVGSGETRYQFPISVGGNGGSGGNGGNVTVTNSASITTIGAMSSAIVAQSIAGGGGMAGTSAAKVQGSNPTDTSVLSLPIAIGATNGTGNGQLGLAGNVTVNNSGAIVTRSHDAIGILAQAISGGGGIVRTRSSDASDNAGGGAVASGGSFGINLSFVGNLSSSQDITVPNATSVVQVNHTGSITTRGQNAYGILAQSIGGGGGLVQSGTPNGSNLFSGGAMIGNAGAVNISVGSSDGSTPGTIATTGLGAVAVLAQSIGGGGGLAGGTGVTASLQAFPGSSTGMIGDGGPVLIQVTPNSSLSTTSADTPVILAQSIGGGGGRISTSSGYYSGTAGGLGSGGRVGVNVAGTVQAAGQGSPGIFAESVGFRVDNPLVHTTGGSAVQINVLRQGIVRGGTDQSAGDGSGAAIHIVGGSLIQDTTTGNSNYVDNFGTITSANGTSGTAIYSTGGWTNVANQPGGQMIGSISLDNGGGGGGCDPGTCPPTVGGNVTNQERGTLHTGALMRLGAAGTLTNAGTLNIGGTGRTATTAMTGTLVQSGTGRLVVDTNHRTGEADRLDVQGAVRLGGTVEVHPASVANRAVTVLTATDGVALDPALTSTRTHLFRFEAQGAGNALLIQPRAEFTGQAASLGANQQAVASHLQDLWEGGANLGGGFDTLAGVSDGKTYARSLDTLSGQTVGAIAAFRYASSHSFTTSMLDDCPTYGAAGRSQEQATCLWSRAFGSSTDQGSTGRALGYRTSAFTLQAGGQRQVAPGLFLGGALAYETSAFRGDAGTSKVTGDTLMLGATLRYQTGSWQFSGVLDAGYGWYDSSRSVEVGSYRATASASPTAWHAGAHARAAYQFAFPGAPGAVLESWYVQPRVDLHLNHVRSGSYTETGAGPFNLAVQREGASTFATVPALEVGGRLRLGEGLVLRPFASAGVSLNANSDWAATARFAGQPNSRGFRAATPIPDVLAKVTAGAELLTGSNWDLRVQYSGEIGDRYTSHTGMARVAYRF